MAASVETPAEALRRHDSDRYFTALFAPAAMRNALVILYAFNHELARAPEVAREPGLVLIRLQWWREVVEGAARAHEVATPLSAAIRTGSLHAPDLLAMIEAREREVEAFPSVAAWCDWLLQGAGSLAVAAGRALQAPDWALLRLRDLGAGYAAAGQLRSIPAFAHQGRCLLPIDLLANHGLDADAVIANPHAPALQPVWTVLAVEGAQLLGVARPCGRNWVAAALPAILGRRDIARPRDLRPRGIGDRLAVTSGALLGRA